MSTPWLRPDDQARPPPPREPVRGTVVVPSRRPVMLLSDRSPRPLNYCLVLGISSGVGVQRTGDAFVRLR
jgi:hypothetical protein